MSLARSVLTFIISSLFILFLYLVINSYIIGNLTQKENLKSFIQDQVTGDMAASNCEDICGSQVNTQTCEDSCTYLEPQYQPACRQSCQNSTRTINVKQTCIDNCMSKTNQSQEKVSEMVDSIYSKELIQGITLNDATVLFSNSLLLMVLTVIFGVSLFFVAEKPMTKIGSNLAWTAISLLVVGVVPVLIIKPDETMLQMVSSYLLKGLYQQLIAGGIVLAIGIAFLLVGKKLNK